MGLPTDMNAALLDIHNDLGLEMTSQPDWVGARNWPATL